MRSPGGHASHRAGRNFEEELSLKYLSPGAFTVLTPQEYGTPPDPPSAPAQYRLTPNSRRRRAQAFSIIAEASSNPGSRSPSPSGRVSPFRGRGFNPAGSRHASPNPSPPPDDIRNLSTKSRYKTNDSPKKSQIPQPYRKGSGGGVFGEKLNNESSPKFRRKNGSKLSPHLSKSLTNLSPKNVASKPPPSPGKSRKFPSSRRPAFEQLSPITGSSPESGFKENTNQSSVSKIPRSSRSQPVSRKTSPTRISRINSPSPKGKNSKSNSQNNSRDPSPTKAQTKIPVNKNNSYREVSAKVNSFSKSKPKVPPKPQDVKTAISVSNKIRSSKPKLSRKETIGKFNTHIDGNSNSANEVIEEGKKSGNTKNSNKKRNDNKTLIDLDKIEEVKSITSGNNESIKQSENNGNSGLKHVESAGKISDISTATTVVSSTTSTAAQPLKIDANLENILKEEFSKPKQHSLYSAAGRVLSATSVSSAINRMNDTVLNSQTLMKDHNFTKLSPAATAIISLSNEVGKGNKTLDTKVVTTALPTIETIHNNKMDIIGQNGKNSFGDSNNVFSVESFDGTVKNFNSIITPENKLVTGTMIQKSANERIREARTMVAADVKPIKILVKEKPSDVEVQSGNVRLPVTATNGLNATPGLPPTEPPENEQPQRDGEEEEATKSNCCTRVFRRCKCKCKSYKCCKKRPAQEKNSETKPSCFPCKKKRTETDESISSEGKSSCFPCKKKKKTEAEELVSSVDNIVGETTKKRTFLDRLKCCQFKKVCRSKCCSRGKTTQQGWADRRVSIASDAVKSSIENEGKCKRFFKRIFCSTCCRCCKSKKKTEADAVSRRESMLSKKKSLTPTLPTEEPKPKIDASLVEHTSLMRAAIPILPLPLAWFCLICNILLPGVGTILSGMFCLCLGKPRFSQKDGPRPRIGAFIINLIIGCGQLFTVLFCLVGWGWSIWWGVIMIKIARKHKRIRLVEQRAQEDRPVPVINQNHHARDVERGS